MLQQDDHLNKCNVQKQFNILELYSGIGGFNFALKKVLKWKHITDYHITAVDINTTANAIYRHNHVAGDTSPHVLLERNIQSFSLKELDGMKLNLLTMSPPCQPFSRLGLKRDLNDNRCDSFRHLMKQLPLLSNQPEYIMLENVKGFDTSEAHELLIETLRKCRYRFEEFLLTPTQFSIPNSRQRYYLIARKSNDSPVGEYTPNIHVKVPFIGLNCSIFSENAKVDFADHIALNMERKVPQIGDLRSPIGAYLEEDNTKLPPIQITDDTLLRYHMLFDIVDPNSTSCNCFTKSYAHRIEGCGSILKTSPDSITIDQIYAEIGKLKEQQSNRETLDQAILDLLRSLELRYFSPKEIANLMCFPPEFEVPSNINHKQKYRVLGNSVNVLVCQYLLQILLGSSEL